MGQYMGDFFISFFTDLNIIGIGLAILFGAVWLTAYWPPLFTRPWLWAVLLSSAVLTLIGITIIQIPLQIWVEQVLIHFFHKDVLASWLLFAGLPTILLSGFIQEATKLIPVIAYWWRQGRSIDPRLGLLIGAVAGAGFGIFEAQWAHNQIFAAGWTWKGVQIHLFLGLAGFWERFFAIAFHIAASALAGHGLARGWGWQFYVLAALAHTLLNYSALFLQSGILTRVATEIFIADVAIVVVAVTLWLRWWGTKEPAASTNTE